MVRHVDLSGSPGRGCLLGSVRQHFIRDGRRIIGMVVRRGVPG